MNSKQRVLAVGAAICAVLATNSARSTPSLAIGIAGGRQPRSQPLESGLFVLSVPIVLHGTFPKSVRPIGSPTDQPPTVPSPTETPLVATPEPTSAPVMFQIATYGGLSMDVPLSYMPSMSPWFTLYADGSYIRIVEHRDEPYGVERFSGRLDDLEMQAFERALVRDFGFFELTGSPEPMICITDHPYDRVHLNVGGRRHGMVVYGLSVYTTTEYRCAEPPDDRLVALAEFVALLREPLSAGEQPYEVERGTLVAVEVRPWPTPLPTWPISGTRLADLPAGSPRALHLAGDEAREAAKVVEDAALYGRNVAYFLENEAFWLVGFRVEYDGWDTYGPSFFPFW